MDLHRTLTRSLLVLGTATVALAASAQTHKVAKPENVVRAVGVYEWTGDMTKPAAMRLIPISLFIDGKLEDAGVYLARPVPFALATGNVFEVEQAGVPKGTIDLVFARHFEPATATTTPFDDGWFGYGKFVPPAPPKKSTLKASTTLAVIDSGDDSRPHFSAKSAVPGSGGAAAGVPSAGAGGGGDAPADDPDRPTLHRGGAATGGTTASGQSTAAGAGTDAANTPPADPDRPTMHRASTGDTRNPDETIDDPDRPTLRRRSPQQAAKPKDDTRVTDVPSLNDDPNRPTLHRGKPAGAATPDDVHQLAGLPPEQDLHQMVAVSDSKDRPVHDFARPFEDDNERQGVLGTIESIAQRELLAYETANKLLPAPTAPPAVHRAASKARPSAAPAQPVAPPALKLMDEQLKAYTLSYGAPATYVYTARTDGTGMPVQYVTVVAEVDMQGSPQVALKSVTDADHLDRTPRMRLVDVVDAEASNRASLLFELRARNARQFALYRVIGAHATQTFLTGTTE